MLQAIQNSSDSLLSWLLGGRGNARSDSPNQATPLHSAPVNQRNHGTPPRRRTALRSRSAQVLEGTRSNLG